MRQLLFVMGGHGPSLVRTALEGAPCPVFKNDPFPHHKYPNGITLGWVDRKPDNRGRGFQAIVLDWMRAAEPERVLVAGHYLANETFFEEVRRQGYDLTVAYVENPCYAPCAEELPMLNLAARWALPPWWMTLETNPVTAARLRLHPVVEGMRRPCLSCEGTRAARERPPAGSV
jgi:hypothetical protein